eukprot:4470519-Amphidinium_carterae.1
MAACQIHTRFKLVAFVQAVTCKATPQPDLDRLDGSCPGCQESSEAIRTHQVRAAQVPFRSFGLARE